MADASSGMAPALPRLATAREVSQQTRIPEYTLREYTRRGLVPHVRIGRAIRYDPAAVAEWLAAGGTQADVESSAGA